MTTKSNSKQIYLIFLIALVFASCSRGRKKVDVSNIKLNIDIVRFDHDFDGMRTKPMAQQAAFLKQKYGDFYHDFIVLLLQDNNINTNDTAYFKLLRKVFATKSYHDLQHDVDSVYPSLEKPTAEITDAFKHIKYYYPDAKLPKLYAYFSGFEAQTVIGDNYFGIGLDMFLGANSRFYPAIIAAYPHYMSRNFNEQNICPRVVEGIAREDMFPESDGDKTLLSRMIYAGKIMYFMDSIMPDVPDTTKIDYTGKQLTWCRHFESKIWGYFMDQNLLYESDYNKIQEYLTEAPFTPGLGEHDDSAPKLAIWTGWQIVRQYMDENPDVTLQQLMADNNAGQILRDSHYHPK